MKFLFMLLFAFGLFAQSDTEIVHRETESTRIRNGMVEAQAVHLKHLLQIAYNIPVDRIFGPSWMEEQTFDLPSTPKASLAQTLTDRFHIAVRKETREMEVYLLRVIPGKEDLLKNPGPPATARNGEIHLSGKGLTMAALAGDLSQTLKRPVLDDTGLRGRFNLDLAWDPDDPAALIELVRQRLGLELAPATRSLEVLVADGAAPPASRP